ncbi:hypothetical protein BU16DRAFT_616116 [Lophium mytilinum]|uniref:Uncharacterized protein n=1 Tax=Lophium mytilinum TaxID=390894 RepID=A0A6A6QYF5_9PEZI|nr:hypothetical protein BU16DRAFT_616116 [Lophium mytilinum]
MAFSGAFDLTGLYSTAGEAPSAAPASEILELQARLDIKSVVAFLQVGKFWGKYEEVMPTEAGSTPSRLSIPAATSSASTGSGLVASSSTATSPPITLALDPAKENRTCKGSFSKLHRLQCLHYVWTPSATDCAPNCLGGQHPTPLPATVQGPHFGCQLCLRAAQANNPALRTPGNHWVDLLLEENFERDSTPLTGLRACQVVFMAKDGTLIPAVEPIDSALIRALMTHRFKLKQRADLDFTPAVRGPSGVDASGFDYDKVPKGPGGGKSARPDKRKMAYDYEARNVERDGGARRGLPSGRGQPLSRGQRSARGRGGHRESSTTADSGLDYGDEGVGGSVAGMRSEEETKARREKRERQKLEKERRKAEKETKTKQEAEEEAKRKLAKDSANKSEEKAEEGEPMEDDEETAKKIRDAEQGLDKMALG